MGARIVAGATLIAVSLLIPNVLGAFDLSLKVDKPAYGPGERIEVYGVLFNGSSPSNNTKVTVRVGSAAYNLTTTGDGSYYSQSDFYPSATLVIAPATTGTYTVNATYNVTVFTSITVVTLETDEVTISLNKGRYLASEAMTATIKATANGLPAVSAVINGTIKNSTGGAVPGSGFSCTTDAKGECKVSLTAPSASGKYSVQTLDGLGFSYFSVHPFSVTLVILDSTATQQAYVFKKSAAGYVNVLVTYNGSLPTGTYTASGTIVTANGSVVHTLTSASLTANNSYSVDMPFTVTSNFTTGNHKAVINVTQTGGETVSAASPHFEVRDWILTIEKVSANSGFEYRYTAFPNTTVLLEAFPTDLATTGTITGLENNFTINLKNSFGANVTAANASYHAGCSCYKFNLTTPLVVGSYRLSVSVYYNETQRVEKVITVTNVTPSVLVTDISGRSRDAFAAEAIYLTPTLANKSNASFQPSDAEVIRVTFQNGSTYNYANVSGWDAVNLTNAVLEWAWNSTTRMIKMDAPPLGGLYKVDVGINNKTLFEVARFIRKPYFIRVSFKNSKDVSVTTDYWWQFKTTDTVYAHVSIVEADVNALKNLTSGGNHSAGGIWGTGSVPKLDSTTEKSVPNASITMKVYHAETGKEERLNVTTSLCQTTSTEGKYICTLQPNESAWVGGGHRVLFSVVSLDGTTDESDGYFEARSFYIYGWAASWKNKPTSTITLNVNAYVAGSDWWSARTSGGISGTAALEKIDYLGTGEYWRTGAVDSGYNASAMNTTTLTNGQGTMSLPPSLTPDGTWKSGSYSAVVKVTETSSGTVDYGRVWFEVRKWDVWSQPVEIDTSGNIQYKWEVNNAENVSLYVTINNAGEWGQSGVSLGGNVSVAVKSIKNYLTWPPKDLNVSKYVATNISVSQSNAYFWGSAINGSAYGQYLLNVSPVGGKWDSGYYSLILDVNGTETGYGWFSAIAFHVTTQSLDENLTPSYAVNGKNPLYFKVETTKSKKWGNSYAGGDYLNTTLKKVTLRRWDQTTYQQVEYAYPGTLNVSFVNVSTLTINGSAFLNITLPGGGIWPFGYYSGELVIEDANGSTGNGWLWIDVRPFRLHFGSANTYTSPSIGLTENLSGEFGVYESDWNSWNKLTGNYTVASVTQSDWTSSGSQITILGNYSPHANATFNGSTNLTVQPNRGGWTGSFSWKNLYVTVRDVTNASQAGNVNFRALPALVAIVRTSGYSISLTANATMNVTVSNPTNTSLGSAINLTGFREWVWDPSTFSSTYYIYNFTVGSCSSATAGSGGCLINSTLSNGSAGGVAVVVMPPAGGWSDGYHYPSATFSQVSALSSYDQWELCDYNSGGCSVSYKASEPITGLSYATSSNMPSTGNATIYVYSLIFINGSSAIVNVTNAQYYKQVGNCMSDSCRIYSNISFKVTDSAGAATGGNNVSSSGYVKLIVPAGNWEVGTYYTKITVQAGSDIASIKGASFSIYDASPPNLTFVTPTLGQVINASTASSFVIKGTTLENAKCSLEIRNFDSYFTSTCGGANQANHTPCNSSAYSGGTYYYKYISGWCSPGFPCVSSGGTTHTYTQDVSEFLVNQDYGVRLFCYDDDWNSAENSTVFTIVGVTFINLTIGNTTLSSPANGSVVNASTINFTWLSTGNASNYTFQLSNASSFSSLTVNANLSLTFKTVTGLADALYYWRVRGFNGTFIGDWSPFWQVTVSVPAENVTIGNVTLSSPGNGSTTTSTTINFTWLAAGNASNYTFQLSNASSFQALINHTNTSTVSQVISNISNASTYYWRVRGFNGTSTGNWSTAWQVTINLSAGNMTINATVLSSPVNGSTNASTVINFTWLSTGNASNYTFQLSNASSFQVLDNHTNTTATHLLVSNLTNGQSYYWRVRGFNGTITGGWSPIWQIAVANAAPAWSQTSVNATAAGSVALFSVYWTDALALSGYIFSTNNTGTWVNDSWASLTGTANWSNVTKTLNATPGLTIGWRVYVNDSQDAWNDTGILSVTTT